MPETAASTNHRPSSTARILLICWCCSDAAVDPYEALLTGTIRNPAPSRTMSRGMRGKLFSKQIGVPKAGRPSASRRGMLCPGVRSTGICLRPRSTTARAPRHVFAERHEVHLVVAIDQLTRRVEQENVRVLPPVHVVRHRADERRRPHGGDNRPQSAMVAGSMPLRGRTNPPPSRPGPGDPPSTRAAARY